MQLKQFVVKVCTFDLRRKYLLNMHIKKGNWKIDIRTFINLEWHGLFPKLIVHEKFENIIKWTLRILAAVGIATSFITLSYKIGIMVSIILFLIEQFLERTIFEYTLFYIQPIPDFDIEYERWMTTGYFLLHDKKYLAVGHLNHIGPAYDNKEYAHKFFSYIRSWNNNLDHDQANNINISIILEDEKYYTMYFYPNQNKEEINHFFSKYKDELALKKYGKRQQELVLQLIFYHKNLEQGLFFKNFISDLQIMPNFFFAPFFIENENILMIEELRIEKSQIKVKHRNDVKKDEIEYHYT